MPRSQSIPADPSQRRTGPQAPHPNAQQEGSKEPAATKNLAEVLFNVGQQIGTSLDRATENNAEADARIAASEVVNEASQRKFGSHEEFQLRLNDKLNEVKKNTAGVNTWDKHKIQRVFLGTETRALIEGSDILLAQAKDDDRASLMKNLESLHLELVLSVEDSNNIDKTGGKRIDEAVAGGILSAQEGVKLKALLSWRSAKGMAEWNPDLAAVALEEENKGDGKFSVFKHLTVDQRAQLRKSVKEAQKLSDIESFKLCAFQSTCGPMERKLDFKTGDQKAKYLGLYNIAHTFKKDLQDLNNTSQEGLWDLIQRIDKEEKVNDIAHYSTEAGAGIIQKFLKDLMIQRQTNPMTEADKISER